MANLSSPNHPLIMHGVPFAGFFEFLCRIGIAADREKPLDRRFGVRLAISLSNVAGAPFSPREIRPLSGLDQALSLHKPERKPKLHVLLPRDDLVDLAPELRHRHALAHPLPASFHDPPLT